MAQRWNKSKTNPSQLCRCLRNLEALFRKWTKPKRSPTPESHFQAIRQRYGRESSQFSSSGSCKSKESRTVFPGCEPPNFRPWSIELESIATFTETNRISNLHDDGIPPSSLNESGEKRAPNIDSARPGQTTDHEHEMNSKAISPTIDHETKQEPEIRNRRRAPRSRKESLLACLQRLQSQVSDHGEKIGTTLAQLIDNLVSGHHNKEHTRESDELWKESNHDSVLVNLTKVQVKIKSLAVVLDNSTTEPDMAFYTMAWLAVHQTKELATTVNDFLSDIRKNIVSGRKAPYGVRPNGSLSYQVNRSLSNLAMAVNQRCSFLVSRLDRLCMEAKARRPSNVISVCASCGTEIETCYEFRDESSCVGSLTLPQLMAC